MKCNMCRRSFKVKELAKIGNRYYCFECCMKNLNDWAFKEGEE